jgi:5-methylcytosine-specific restriction endonuclease McrA
MLVYVLNKHGKPVMPCNPAKARLLLKEKKARVVRRTPFTIQLLYGSSGYKQPVTLGVDSGYNHVGLSAVTDKKELYSADVKLREDISKLLSERRKYRRARRNRNLWHRKARFLNRKKPTGWLAPSIQHKLDSHIKVINKVREILPISEIVVEVSSFDTQKMQNPEIKSIEYQKGELQGYRVKEYLLEKWGRKCAYCKKTNVPLEVEHIIPKSRGGSNRVSNMTISCKKCNQNKGNKTAEEFGYPKIQEKAKKSLKEIAFMNSVRWKLVKQLYKVMPDSVSHTYGYITKFDRKTLGIEKSHNNDAFVIAGGNKQKRLGCKYFIKQVRKCNRKLYRGKRSEIRNTAPRFIHGFQRYDKVLFNGIECLVYGRRTSGYFDLKRLDGTKIHSSANYKDLVLLESAGTFLTERRC